jgi:hypothetical protein
MCYTYALQLCAVTIHVLRVCADSMCHHVLQLVCAGMCHHVLSNHVLVCATMCCQTHVLIPCAIHAVKPHVLISCAVHRS